MYDDLIQRLHRYTENYVAYKFDADFASAVREAADAIEKLSQIETDLSDYRNELCIKCGQYQTKHLGSCNGCRWEKS